MKNSFVTVLTVSLLLLTPLSGCLSTNGPAPTNPNTELEDAYGLWDPVVDGYLSLVPDQWGQTEWSDALEEVVSFKEATSGGALTQNSYPANFHLKKVLNDPENTLALAVELDLNDPSVKSGNLEPSSVEVTMESRSLVNPVVSIQNPISGTPPTYVGNLGDYLESVYDPIGEKLVVEASCDDLFMNTNEIDILVKIIFTDGSFWTYSRISHFKYVVPINVPQNDLKIEGMEVVQAVQTENNDVSLVHGKETMVRVFVDSTLMPTAHTKVTLQYCWLIMGCFDHMEKLHLAVQNPDRENIAHSANFIIPEFWTWDTSGIAFRASVEPYYPNGVMDYAEIDWDTNKLLDYTIRFHYTSDMTVWTVRVGQQTDPSCTGSNCINHMSSFESELLMDHTEVLLPVTDLNTVDFPNSMVPECPWDWGADSCMSAVETWWRSIVLSGNSPYRNADQVHTMTPLAGDEAGFHDYGGLSAPAWAAGYGGTGSTIGWQPLIGSLHSARGVCGLHTLACTAHEMTHNFGPYCWDAALPGVGVDCNDLGDEAWGNHLSVTGFSGTDPCYADGMDPVWNAHYGMFNIKGVGWNPTTPNADTNQLAIVYSNYPDYMSNCEAHISSGGSNNWRVPALTYGDYKQWVSTHRWEWLFDKFDNWMEGNPAHPYNGRSEQKARMIVGTFENDGTGAALENSWVMDGFVEERYRQYGQDLEEEAKYTILAKDREGVVLETIRFGISNITEHLHDHHEHHATGNSSFVYTLQDDSEAIYTIELYDYDELIDVLTSDDQTLSVSMDEIGEVSRSSSLDISWCVKEFSGERCSENLFYSQLEYTWDGLFWMPLGVMKQQDSALIDLRDFPGGDSVQFRIRVSNGFDTATGLSESFSLPNLIPKIELDISGPSEFAMGSTSIGIRADITDPEWGDIHCENITGWLDGPADMRVDVWPIHDSQNLGRDGLDNDCDGGVEDDDDLGSSGHSHAHSHGGASHTHYHTHGGVYFDTSGWNLEPGDYVYNIQYVDSDDVVVHADYRFTVTAPEYSSIPIEEFRKLLVHIDDVVDSDLMYRGREVSRAMDAESDLDVDI